MIEIIRFVKERGPEYGYRLNLGKCIYLLSHNPSDRLSVDQKVARILDLGIPIENIKVHPDCEPDAPRELILKRQREYGFKMLGSFVGTDSFVLNALQGKAVRLDEVASKLLRYPNAQARYHLHKFCFNEKINYWLRTQFPEHTIEFIDHFKSIQLKLIASHHGVYDQRDLDFRPFHQ